MAAVIAEELPRQEVVRLFAVGHATLERWLARWRAGESLAARQSQPGPVPHFDQAALRRLQAQVAADPDARLSDHVCTWQKAVRRPVSESTLWRGLRALGWTRKKSTS